MFRTVASRLAAQTQLVGHAGQLARFGPSAMRSVAAPRYVATPRNFSASAGECTIDLYKSKARFVDELTFSGETATSHGGKGRPKDGEGCACCGDSYEDVC